MTEDALSPEEVDALLADTERQEEEDIDDSIEAGSIEPSEKKENKEPAKKDKKKSEDSEEEDLTTSEQQQRNIQLLLDIYMRITVELGRTKYKVKDILAWGEGSIIELEKPATEPVNLLVNKRLVARGEVVVIDENFGVRITEIVNPRERLLSLTR
jgi:flagellar motor switch protein FliN/FliY